MWTERHEPRCEADCAWSTQKLAELKKVISEILSKGDNRRQVSNNPTAPGGGVVLMYGPSGCGKLSTLRALFGGVEGIAIDVLHAAEATLDELKVFLSDSISATTSLRSIPKPKPLSTTSQVRAPARSAARGEGSDDVVVVSDGDDDLMLISSSTPPPAAVAASSTTRRAFIATPPAARKESAARAAQEVMMVPAKVVFKVVKELPVVSWSSARKALDSALTSFIDIFAARVAGTLSAPSTLSQEEEVEEQQQRLGRPNQKKEKKSAVAAATPPLVIVVFMRTVHDTHSEKVDLSATFPAAFLSAKAAQQTFWRGGPAVPHVSSSSSSSALGDIVHQFRCTAVTVIAMVKRLTAICKKEGFDDVPPEALTALAEQCSGDMRQAVIQLQWLCLLPPTQSASTATLPQPSLKAAASSKRGQKSATNVAPVLVGGKRTRTQTQARNLIDLCDDFFEPLPASKPPSTQVSEPKTSPALAAVPDQQQQQPPASSAVTMAIQQLPAIPEISGPDDGGGGGSDGQSFRNEYIDVGHAAARLLTQKYQVDQVLRVITVPSWKLLGFVTHNMHHYFNLNQIAELAECSRAASELDRSLPFSDSGTYSASNLRISDVVLTLFAASYRCEHRYVQIPKTFMSLRAPPFQEQFFPVTVDIHSGRRGRRFGGGGGGGRRYADETATTLSQVEADDEDSYMDSGERDALNAAIAAIEEQSDLQRFQDRMLTEAGGKPLNVVGCAGFIRETLMPKEMALCSVVDVMTDFAPLAARIVLDLPNNCGEATATAAANLGVVLPSAVPAAPPKRTLFVPGGGSGVGGAAPPAIPDAVRPKRTLFSNAWAPKRHFDAATRLVPEVQVDVLKAYVEKQRKAVKNLVVNPREGLYTPKAVTVREPEFRVDVRAGAGTAAGQRAMKATGADSDPIEDVSDDDREGL